MPKLKINIMRKLMLLFVLLVPFIVLSQGQLPLPSNVGLKAPGNDFISSGNRSIPPGVPVWSQLPDCANANAYSCQLDQTSGYDFQIADDFLFTSFPGEITAVRWWILWYNSPEYLAPTSFNIYIYNDVSCLPGNLVAQWNVPFANANEDATCFTGFPAREYWATLNPAFLPIVNQHYWIVTQPVMIFPPQTGIPVSATQNLCPGSQQFFAPFVPMGNDFAFELYSSPLVPVSNWAIFIGIGLILVFAVVRFKKMV
jgi:hypothetical protein